MENKIDRTPALLITASGSFLTPFVGSSVNVALPSIGREFSMDAILLNWVSTSYILSAAMFLVPMGRIADIHGRKKIFTQGILIFTIFSLLLGFALFSSPDTNAVMSSVDKKFYGVSSGTIATMRLIGQMLSMDMATLLFAIYLGRVQITAGSYPLFLKSARMAFTIFAFLCIGGIFASLARGKVR